MFTNRYELDGHFGTCRRYLIYQVSPSEVRLVDVRSAGVYPLNRIEGGDAFAFESRRYAAFHRQSR